VITIAKATYKLPEDFLLSISALADKTDDIVPRVLEAGGKVVLAKVRGNLSSVIGRGKYPSRATGELVRSLGLSPARLDKNGNFDVKVGFAEPRRGKGGSNAKLANIIEYGKHGQPARPFLKPAKSAARAECISAMKSKLEEEINKV